MQTSTVHLDKPTVDRLKRDLSMLEVLKRYGIHAERTGKSYKAHCPFHKDEDPSLSIDPLKNTWKCFGCGEGSSVIDFVMKKEGIDFRTASIQLLTSNPWIMTGAELLERQQQSTPEPSRPNLAPLTAPQRRTALDAVDWYHTALSGEDRRGLEYLKSRGLADPDTLKAFKVGYVTGSFKTVVPDPAILPLVSIGILAVKKNPDGSPMELKPEEYSRQSIESGLIYEFFQGCIVVPIFTESGELGEMYGRSVTGSRHLYLPGQHRGVLNAKAAQVHPDGIILAEAVLDALAVYAIGHKNVVPCYGTHGFTADHAAMLCKHGVQKVFIAFDADKAGDTAAKKLADRLSADGIACHRVHLPREIGTDLNDYVQALRREGMKPDEIHQAFAELLRKAPQIGHKRPKRQGPAITLADPSTVLGAGHTGDVLVFNNCEVSYRLRGLFDNSGTSLRVVLSANMADITHTDRFDLYTAKSRVGFAHRAGNRLELPPAKIEEDLNTLIPMLETLLAEGKGKADETKAPPPLSEADRKEALALLKSKNLLRRLCTDLETVGYVGEDQNKQLAYLIATSRKLTKPLSAIIRSESGAGKSFLMECVAELMPEEEVQYFSRLTPQSLYYMGENELVNKLLIVDERDGSEEAEYPIRTLQTRRKLTLAVPMKDASSGKIKTTMLTINGPIAYMESSTQQSINPENLNRCFELYLDATEKQTARIMARQRQARTLAGLARDDRRGKILRQHRNAQRLLRPLTVVIPFADRIAFPTQWLRTRRDHERFLCLLEIVAFLHQHQRPTHTNDSGTEYIEATVDDYAITYRLAQTVFAQSVHDLTKPARDLFDQVKRMVARDLKTIDIKQKDYWFTRRNIREYTKLPDHQIKRTIRQLEDLEYLEVRRSASGGSHRYRLPAQSTVPTLFEGLTTPQELAEKQDNRDKSGTTAKIA